MWIVVEGFPNRNPGLLAGVGGRVFESLALLDVHVIAQRRPFVELARTADLELRIGNPSRLAAQRFSIST